MDAELRGRLREIHRLQRQTHRVLFDLQGESIRALRDALNAIGRTHDEMMQLFASDNTLEEDIIEDRKDASGGQSE